MKTIRAFFAIMPPQEMQVHLLKVLKKLKPECPANIRWVDPKNIHITLQFLSQLLIEDVKPLSDKVREELKNIPHFQLTIGPLEWFPSPKHPKVLSLVVEPQEILLQLANSIAQAVDAFHYPMESRTFRAHMTIGRVQYDKHKKSLLSHIELDAIPPIFIDKIHLMESKLGKEKMDYFPLTQFDLNTVSS